MEGMVAYRVGLAIGAAGRRDAAAAADGSLGDEGLVSGYHRVLLDFVADRLHFFRLPTIRKTDVSHEDVTATPGLICWR